MKALLVILCLTLITFSFNAEAIRISRKKGSKVMIQLDGESASKGDLFRIYDKRGKKRGLVKITGTRGSRATGRVKGKAKKGWKLKFYKASRSKKGRLKKSSSKESSSSKSMVGAQFGYQSNSMKISTGAGTNLTGTSFSLMAFYDTPAFSSVWLRFNVGVQSLTATSGDTCTENGVNESCSVDIMYLGLGGVARYMFTKKGSMRYWAGAGVLANVPLSKKASALQEATIKTTHIKTLNGGVDYYLSSKMMIPVEFSYGIYPDSSTTTSTVMSLKVGIGYKF